MRSRDPVFIGGMFKSGTSLLARHARPPFTAVRRIGDPMARTGSAGGHAAERRAWLERLSIFFDVPRRSSNKPLAMPSEVEACLDRLMRLSGAARRKVPLGREDPLQCRPYRSHPVVLARRQGDPRRARSSRRLCLHGRDRQMVGACCLCRALVQYRRACAGLARTGKAARHSCLSRAPL